ncbi:hypothetical protein LCGC14_1092080 [marine sediment metagenome]|uniref:Uncharacterized protein n=1 Tax=marine sediment metagenome TaxID=412755 RepID=A0A0F9MGE3_9ZZZZ
MTTKQQLQFARYARAATPEVERCNPLGYPEVEEFPMEFTENPQPARDSIDERVEALGFEHPEEFYACKASMELQQAENC